MRVLLIDVNCEGSSTGKIAYSLCQVLSEQGHPATLCYGRGKKTNKPGAYKFGLDTETYVHAGLARLLGKNGYYSPFSTRRLIHYIEQFKPDLIHIHELHAYFVNIYPLLEYIKRKQIPVVWTFHCEYMYTGKCGYAYDCQKWLQQCGQCPAIKEYPKSLFFDCTRSMYGDKKCAMQNMELTIITPSQWLAQRVKQSFLAHYPIQVIHNGIDTQTIFYPREKDKELLQQITPNKKIILSVAPNIMEDRKGGKYILQLSQQVNNKPFEFVLIGADETKRYSDNVLLIRRTKNQDELAKWYSLADAFLICSTIENFPTTCLEALSCGTPVLGFNCGGTSETAPAPYGRFVPKGDLDGLKSLILQHNTTPFMRQTIRQYACEHYDMRVMTRHYIQLYQTILNSKKSCERILNL